MRRMGFELRKMAVAMRMSAVWTNGDAVIPATAGIHFDCSPRIKSKMKMTGLRLLEDASAFALTTRSESRFPSHSARPDDIPCRRLDGCRNRAKRMR